MIYENSYTQNETQDCIEIKHDYVAFFIVDRYLEKYAAQALGKFAAHQFAWKKIINVCVRCNVVVYKCENDVEIGVR